MKIRIFYSFILLVLITNQLYSQNNTTSVSIPASQLIIDGNNYNINPGDTIRLSSGIKEYLRISNFHGDSLHYIVFINDSGSVIIQNNSHPFGILIVNSSYFKFTGTGVDTIKYGFKILKTTSIEKGKTRPPETKYLWYLYYYLSLFLNFITIGSFNLSPGIIIIAKKI
jgi:hypothetical protein